MSVDFGDGEYPVATSAVTAGWSATETGNVAGPTAFATTDRAMVPNQNLGIQMKLTRRALKQSGAGLAAAIRRDMASTIAAELDNAALNGAASSGAPEVLLTNCTYNIPRPAASATDRESTR